MPRRFLMLHAAMGNAERFHAWVPMLSRHYRVMRLDLRGHGNSATPAPDSAFDMEPAGQGHARADGSSGLQERPRGRQLGRRLHRPEPRHGSSRAGSKSLILFGSTPGLRNSQAREPVIPRIAQERHPEIPDGHDRGPLRAGHRSAQDRLVRLMRRTMCDPAYGRFVSVGPDVLARLERSAG